MHSTTILIAMAGLLATTGFASRAENIHFYSGNSCSGTDDSKQVNYNECTTAPQGFLSYDPKDIKTSCNVYSDSNCQNKVSHSEKGATTCQKLSGGTGNSVVCFQHDPL